MSFDVVSDIEFSRRTRDRLYAHARRGIVVLAAVCMVAGMTDRDILIATLEEVRKRQEAAPPRGLLSVPSEQDLKEVEEAIERCETFKSAEGQHLFSAESLIPIHAPLFSSTLVSKVDPTWNQIDPAFKPRHIEDCADWLLRLLSTREAEGRFIAVIWGLEIEKPVVLSNDQTLMPFKSLTDSSYVAGQIASRGKNYGTLWISQRFWDQPGAVLVQKVPCFPYIGCTYAPVELLENLRAEAKGLWTFLEVAAIGEPLVFASWFEYVDSELDISGHENTWTWSHAEVIPQVTKAAIIDGQMLAAKLAAFEKLPADFQNVLLRSGERFILSQCRSQDIDRVLDQALAFEIAVAGGSDGGTAPPSWKVSVRAAQMIGGDLETRKQNRTKLAAFYRLRNQATHGGRLREKEVPQVDEAAAIYGSLFDSYLRFGDVPNWSEIEMQPIFDL